jgi:hypothetical protein
MRAITFYVTYLFSQFKRLNCVLLHSPSVHRKMMYIMLDNSYVYSTITDVFYSSNRHQTSDIELKTIAAIISQYNCEYSCVINITLMSAATKSPL